MCGKSIFYQTGWISEHHLMSLNGNFRSSEYISTAKLSGLFSAAIYKKSDYKHRVKRCFERYQHMHYWLFAGAQRPPHAVGQERSDHTLSPERGCGAVPPEALLGHTVLSG